MRCESVGMNRMYSRGMALALLVALAACAPKGDALYARAEKALAAGDSSAAIIDLKNLVQAEPQNARARALLGQALVASGDIAVGEVEILKAKELGAPADTLVLATCRLLVYKGQFAQALADCRPEAGSAAQQGDLQLVRGQALLGLGRAAEAKTMFEAVLAAQPDSLDARVGLANATVSTNGYEAGKAVMAGAPAEVLEQARYWLALGAMSSQAGAQADAEQAYQKAVDKAGEKSAGIDRMMALGGLAETQVRQGNIAAADVTSARLLKMAPKHPLARQLRGQVAAAAGKLDEARGLLEGVVAEQPDNQEATLLLGYVNLQQGNVDQAEMHYQSVVARHPENARAQRLLAELRASQDSPAEAMASMKSALKQTSNDPTMLALAGRMSLASGDRAQALAYLAEAAKPGTELTPQVQLEVANGYLLAGETDKALAILRSMPDSGSAAYQRDSLLLLTLQRKGDEAQLMAQSKAMLARSPQDPVLRNLVGSVYAASGKMDLARAQFNEALRLAPSDAQSLINLAKVEYAQGKPAAAEAQLRKLLESDPKNLQATLAMAATAGARKDMAAVGKYLTKARDDHPDSVEAQVALAQFQLSSQNLAQAKATMDAAVAANPKRADMANARGVIMMAARDLPAGLASFEEAVRLDAKSIEFALNLARAKGLNRDHKGALATIDDALRRDPKSVPALGLGAATSLQAGDMERATGYVERIQQAAPGSSIAYQMEGDLAMAQQRYRDALVAYEKADPSLNNRGVTMARYIAAQRAKLPNPAKVVEQWVAAHPDDADAVGILAEQKRNSGDLTGAAQMYESAIAKAKDNAALNNNLAMIYIETGDPRAVPTAEKAHQLMPRAPAIQDTYGWALFKSGKTDKALELLAEAARGMPDNAEVQYHYAAALAAAGRKSEALPFARKAVAGALPPAVRADATRLLAEIQ